MKTIDEEVIDIFSKKTVKSSGFERFPLKEPIEILYYKPSQWKKNQTYILPYGKC
jgi:hypothetical protein